MSRTIKAESTYPVRRPSGRDIRQYATGPERTAVRDTLRAIVNDPTVAYEAGPPVDQHRHGVLWIWA